jgi:hypothetical protein
VRATVAGILLAFLATMPHANRNPPAKISGKEQLTRRDAPKEKQAREALREQAKTEVEERPYLDTMGGE